MQASEPCERKMENNRKSSNKIIHTHTQKNNQKLTFVNECLTSKSAKPLSVKKVFNRKQRLT